MIKKQDKSRIVQIWGDILDHGFTSVPNILLRYRSNLGIRSQHLALIIDIMSFKWDSENPFPSYSTLAQRAGVDERSIKRITQDLEELNLLIKTPRFDEESGAQITTIFDFRPLVKKLTEEMDKTTFEEKSWTVNNTKTNNKEGDKFVTGGVTNNSWGRVTNLSPKEDSLNNKTQLKKNKNTLDVQNTENQMGKTQEKAFDTRKEKTRVLNHFRNGIFRKRLFEIYNNLHDVKTIQELVEEGAYKACKEIMLNRTDDLLKNQLEINPSHLAKEVRLKFPYHKIPKSDEKSRNFFVASICNLILEELTLLLNKF